MPKPTKSKLASWGSKLQSEARKIKRSKPSTKHVDAIKQAAAKLRKAGAFK